MNQGKKANRSGSVLERTVEGTLQGYGYVQICQNLPKKRRREWLLSDTSPQRYARQVYIGPGIYGSDIYVDFYTVGLAVMPELIIECKWQHSGGSVDEKLPYLNLNIKDCYPAPAIVLIDGGGMKPGAVEWLSRQVDSNRNLLGVYTLSNFMIWANKNL